jgi:predicted transcriptional regulator
MNREQKWRYRHVHRLLDQHGIVRGEWADTAFPCGAGTILAKKVHQRVNEQLRTDLQKIDDRLQTLKVRL